MAPLTRLAVVLGLLLGSPFPALSADAGAAAAGQPPAPSAAYSQRYIVQLADAPLATYDGSLAGLPATAPAVLGDGAGLDPAAPGAAAYAAYLDGRQRAFEHALRAVAPVASVQYHYRVALNGLTVRLSAAEAARVRAMPGVVAVTPEEPVVPLMDASTAQIGAQAAWQDPRVGGRADAGRGVRVAVIDSGISAEHPMFADDGFVAPPGFPRATLTVGDVVTAYPPADLARYTNRKVIVARAYANPETFDPGQPVTPLADGPGGFHGAHVAGTAAGAVVDTLPDGEGHVLSGVAPGAYIMAYKFTNAYTPEILRIIDDAVADGAHVINNSWGTAAMNLVAPAHHPVAEAFRNATAAGVVVVSAAGNSGANGEATLGGPHQMLDEAITVANVQTGRTFGTFVLAADAGLPEALERHPTQQFDMGNEWSRVRAPALASDLCSAMDLVRARGKVVLMPVDAVCEQPLIQLPIELPEPFRFVQSLLVARLAGVEAVVMVAPTAVEAAQRALILTLLDLGVGMGGEAVGQFQFPVTAVIGGEAALSLAEWSAANASLVLTLSRSPQAVPAPELADVPHVTSSQGPAPIGPGVAAKPDLAAPGSYILSASTTTAGQPDGYAPATGTSMASPHVAGAAAVLRQAWPAWTPAQVKAALLTTAEPVAAADGNPAPTTVQGAGRLDLARALEPGLIVTPPSLSDAGGGQAQHELRLLDVRRAARDDAVYRVRHEPGPANRGVVPVATSTVVVPEGGSAVLRVAFRADDAPPGTHDGWIVLESDEHVLRVFYQVHRPREPKDVLLLHVRRSVAASGGPMDLLQPPRFSDTPDYAPYWTAALDEAGLTYDVWTVSSDSRAGTPPLSVLRGYDVVMLAAGDGNAPLDQLPGGMTALQMYLLGGGRLIVSGNTWDHGPPSLRQLAGLQASGAMYFLSRYFAGFERTHDNVAPAGALTPPAGGPFEVLLGGRSPALAAPTATDAAGNGGAMDLGRPLQALQTAGADAMQPPMDIGSAAPVVVESVMPYMLVALNAPVDGRPAAAMTAVSADARLEWPRRAPFIPWRAAFAGFPFEALAASGAEGMSRAELLAALHRWAVEPEVEVRLTGPAAVDPGQTARLAATMTGPAGVTAARWRWDTGSGEPHTVTDTPELGVTFQRPATRVVRVEATTHGGHTYVAQWVVRVGGVYLPAAARGAPIGRR